MWKVLIFDWLHEQIRKREWNEQGSHLKARINTKLSFYQAVARLQIKSLASLDSDGKSSKKLWLEALVLFTEAAEACLLSVWRKLRMCEELFSSLVEGMTKIAVTKGGQPLRVLLIRLKLLVLTACAQVHFHDRFLFFVKLVRTYSSLFMYLCKRNIILWTIMFGRQILGPAVQDLWLIVS